MKLLIICLNNEYYKTHQKGNALYAEVFPFLVELFAIHY